ELNVLRPVVEFGREGCLPAGPCCADDTAKQISAMRQTSVAGRSLRICKHATFYSTPQSRVRATRWISYDGTFFHCRRLRTNLKNAMHAGALVVFGPPGHHRCYSASFIRAEEAGMPKSPFARLTSLAIFLV